MIVVAGRALSAAVGTLGIPFVPIPLAGANSFKVTSAPFDPPANSLLFAVPLNRNASLMGAQAISDNSSGALSWTLRNDKIYDIGAGGGRARMRVFCALIGASPPTGLTITSTSTLARSCLATVCLTGPTTIPTNFDADDAMAKSSAGDLTCTLPTPPAATSTILTFLMGAVAAGDTQLPTDGGGIYTELEDVRHPDGQILAQTCYLSGGGAVAVSWNNPGFSGPTIGSVIEVPLPG